jgi:hypothetical protein
VLAVAFVSIAVTSVSGTLVSAQTTQAPAPAAGRGARGGGGVPPAPQNLDTMTPQQVQQYYDSVVLLQAKQKLQLSEDQFLRFGARFKTLQMIQRQYQRRRMMALRDLSLMLTNTSSDDATVATKVKEIDDMAVENDHQVADARAAIDSVLSVRQRAQFRVFSAQVENRSLSLIAQARQANKAAP